MKNLDKYLSLLSDGQGLLLTSRFSRHYGAQFDIAEGVAIVTKQGCRYFTDSRYIESAQSGIQGFEVLDIAPEGYIKRIKGNHRLIVAIEGVIAVATSYIPNCFLEKIEKETK